MPSTAASRSFPCATCEVRDQTICAALGEAELRELNAIATSLTVEPAQAIFYEGDRDAYLFNVTAGAVRLSKLLPDGRRQVIGFLFPGDLLGLSIAGTFAYTADAITETSLCRFDRRPLTRLAEKYPNLEHRVVALASNELVQAQDHLMILGQKTASERIATVLLRLAERIGSKAGDGRVVEVPMSREDIADYAGLTIETVSRKLSRLREAGVIEILTARQIHIPRMDALAELSGDV
jgi:CRP/FNR family transcriptional regulator